MTMLHPPPRRQILEAIGRLSMIAPDFDLPAKAAAFSASLWGRVRQIPMAASGAVNAIDTVRQSKKLVLVNPAKDMIEAIRSMPDPSRLDLIARNAEEAQALLPGSADYDSGKTKGPAAYLCRGPVCLPPVFDADSLSGLLRQPAD